MMCDVLTQQEQNWLADIRIYEESLKYDVTYAEEIIIGIVEDNFGYSFEDASYHAFCQGALISDIVGMWAEADAASRKGSK
jgi:hypothetical protein